jgi:hypothetical protein
MKYKWVSVPGCDCGPVTPEAGVIELGNINDIPDPRPYDRTKGLGTGFKVDIDPAWLHKKYWIEGWQMEQIAGAKKVSVQTIYRRLDEFGIPRRTPQMRPHIKDLIRECIGQ